MSSFEFWFFNFCLFCFLFFGFCLCCSPFFVSASTLGKSFSFRSQGSSFLTMEMLGRQLVRCLTYNPIIDSARFFHSTPCLDHLMKLTRCRVVDNSAIGKIAMAEGKPPKIIHIYNKKGIGSIGDKVLVAIKGEKKKAIIVGVKKHQPFFVPRTDTNNIVLIEENGAPMGTRIHVPIPTILRKILKFKTHSKGPDYTKVLTIASTYI